MDEGIILTPFDDMGVPITLSCWLWSSAQSPWAPNIDTDIASAINPALDCHYYLKNVDLMPTFRRWFGVAVPC